MLLLQGLLGNAFNQSCSVLSVHIIILIHHYHIWEFWSYLLSFLLWTLLCVVRRISCVLMAFFSGPFFTWCWASFGEQLLFMCKPVIWVHDQGPDMAAACLKLHDDSKFQRRIHPRKHPVLCSGLWPQMLHLWNSPATQKRAAGIKLWCRHHIQYYIISLSFPPLFEHLERENCHYICLIPFHTSYML